MQPQTNLRDLRDLQSLTTSVTVSMDTPTKTPADEIREWLDFASDLHEGRVRVELDGSLTAVEDFKPMAREPELHTGVEISCEQPRYYVQDACVVDRNSESHCPFRYAYEAQTACAFLNDGNEGEYEWVWWRNCGKHTQRCTNPSDVSQAMDDARNDRGRTIDEIPETSPAQPEREPKRMWGDVYVDSNGSLECTACVSREEHEQYFGECTEFREVLRGPDGNELPTKTELQAGELILSLTNRIREREPRIAELEAERNAIWDVLRESHVSYDDSKSLAETVAILVAENERISCDRETFLNAACYWWMTYHDAMGIVRPNAMSEGIQEAVAKIESERKRLKELEVENARSKDLLNAGSVIVEDCNRAMELLNAHGSQDGTMLEKVAAMVDENERLKAKVRESDDQFSRIAKVLGGDATDAPESDRTVAGFVIQRFAAERRASRGDKAELEELRNAMQCVLMGDEYGGCACPSLIADVAFGRARQAREKAEAEE